MQEHNHTEKTYHDQKTTKRPITWEAHEYVYVEKTSDWYWALGVLAIAGIAGALFYENVLFALFILIASSVLALFASRHPDVVKFSLTQRGVRIDDVLHPYNSFVSFAVDEITPQHIPKLILKPTHALSPLIVIPIVDVDPDDVHDFLRLFLKEEDHYEPLTHRMMEWLGF